MKIKIQQEYLPWERRIRLFRQYGILTRKDILNPTIWELLLPAGVEIIEAEDPIFWLFDDRTSTLIGVLTEPFSSEGGRLQLM